MLAKLRIQRHINCCLSYQTMLSIVTHSKIPNLLWKDHLETFVDNASLNKGLNNIESTTFIQNTTNKNLAIHKLIYDASSSEKIVDILRQNTHQITHGSVYGLAMNKCCKNYKDYEAIQVIMDTLLTQKTTRVEKIAFNIFFNYMSHCDSPALCIKYFDFMVNRSKVKPDLFTFSALIKGCRHQGDCELAEKYFRLMRKVYHIEANEFIYNEMLSVYSKAQNVSQAIKLFDKYLKTFVGKYTLITFNVYLSVFASVGDIGGLHDTFKLMQSHNMNPDMITFTHLMKGYNTAKRPLKALQIFDKITTDYQWKASSAQLFYKCVALCMIMRKERDFESKKELYVEIEHVIKRQFDVKKVKRLLIGRVIFEAAILLYHDVDPMKIIHIFESFVEQKMIGYMNKNDGEWKIDLHCFVPLQAQFILRYILGFKINELADKVSIITGVGKHASSKRQSGKLQQFVINELMDYKPPIKCTIDPNNYGVLLLDIADLEHYRNNKMNCIREKIMYPSKDWVLSDFVALPPFS